MTTRWFSLLALSSILSTACRPTGTKSPESRDDSLRIPQPFPTRERLDAIASSPAPPPADVVKFANVATSATTAEAKTLAEILGPSRRVTEQMSCFAREIGAFKLKHTDEPPPDLIEWIAMRCGVGLMNANLLIMKKGTLGSARLDAAQDREPILAAAKAVRGPADFGIGVADDGKTATLVIAAVQRTSTFAEIAMVPQDGHVVVAGETAAPIGWVSGHVTRGADGVGACAPVAARSTSAQAFALSCPVELGDPSANIAVSMARPGALMGFVELQLWASPDGSLGDTWVAPSAATPVAAGESDALAWLTGVNAIRERNQLKPWSFAKAQSKAVDELSPHLFDAEPTTRDNVALGILAGWDVEGSIRDADLQFLTVPSGVPLSRALGAAMRRPTFRAMVMAKHRDVGALSLRKGPTGSWDRVVIAGYGLFQRRDYLAEEEAFLDQLDAHRAARNLPPVERVGGPKDRKRLGEAADRVRDGKSEPMEELEGLLDHFAQATGHRMRGAIYTTLKLDGFRPDFRDALATASGVVVMVKIADWRPPGSAWGQQIIYVVYTVPGDRGGSATE